MKEDQENDQPHGDQTILIAFGCQEVKIEAKRVVPRVHYKPDQANLAKSLAGYLNEECTTSYWRALLEEMNRLEKENGI